MTSEPVSDPDLRCWLCNVRCDQKPEWAVVVRVFADSKVAAAAVVQKHFDRLEEEIGGRFAAVWPAGCAVLSFTVTDVTEDTP